MERSLFLQKQQEQCLYRLKQLQQVCGFEFRERKISLRKGCEESKGVLWESLQLEKMKVC